MCYGFAGARRTCLTPSRRIARITLHRTQTLFGVTTERKSMEKARKPSFGEWPPVGVQGSSEALAVTQEYPAQVELCCQSTCRKFF